MIKPPSLVRNNTIAIVAPAGKVEQNVVNKSRSVIKEWGLNIKIAENLFQNHFGFSANDEQRINDFQQALDDPHIKAILCARGGYGTNRIIDQLNFKRFKENPKWIIGFSDITVLHSHIQQNLEIETTHGSMCYGLTNRKASLETKESLRKILFGEELKYEIKPLDPSKTGVAKGILTGGNLAILISLLGTNSEIDYTGKILFIEEVGEHLYRIDRMMTQLKRAGKLAKLAGLIVGGFNDLPDSEDTFGSSAHDIILEKVKDYKYPVLFGFPAGHGNDNRSMIFGRTVKLELNNKATISF